MGVNAFLFRPDRQNPLTPTLSLSYFAEATKDKKGRGSRGQDGRIT